MSDKLIVNIKSEIVEVKEDSKNADTCYNDESSHIETYNTDLIEDVNSNEKLQNEIGQFFEYRNEVNNKKNLINYCGILDPASETGGCARVNSIYVAKFGKSHIKSKGLCIFIPFL